ncbi:DUF1642 domain-containing protein [Streptococcus uberis]|uniref:DUF1642 domain-containing protein n=1 Tax=Streptococcus uberis TaxID=1349 RepID=UPI0006204882|nr:DUF1642 domain-containing protein [Streptococcus uberis]KKF40859.1 hypothetical protein AF64_08820 [Streptococcus uberis C9359]KKF51714.1 hypothetical protein AF65_08880 [Streptococcus uberis C5388]QBX22085.1 hypothetical protein Javan633_0032 [Streptococcus phage Javan633]QBX31276.1 hypothetical protein Javan628_0032 [Streptococcus phage Javan628]
MKIEELKQGQTVYVKGIITDIEEDEILDLEIHTSENNFCVNSSDVYVSVDQPKPVVPQVAIDYYNEYKNVLSSFDEWFCGFYDDKFDEEFEKAEELRIWLYDNDNKINLQHELALATLIVNGPDAVTVEKEKLYTVEIPTNSEAKLALVRREDKKIVITIVGEGERWRDDPDMQLTEQEIRKDFDWAWQWKKEVTE